MRILEGDEASSDPVRRSVAAYQKTGNPHALLQAAVNAMHQSNDVPTEVAMAFHAAVARFEKGEARTLDEAFCVTRKGVRLADYRRWRRYSAHVYHEVCRLHEEEAMPIDESTFEKAGAKFNVRKTLAGEMYYAWRDGKQNERGRVTSAPAEPFEPKQISDETIKHEWDRSRTLRDEFNNEFEDYRAYRRGVAAGRIWVDGERLE